MPRRVPSKKYFGRVNGKPVALSESREASKRILARMRAEADLAAAGVIPAAPPPTPELVGPALADYASRLRLKGDTPRHVRDTLARVSAVEGPDGPLYADFHALRHSCLTALGRVPGVSLRTVQEVAGHSTPVLTARYMRSDIADQAAGLAGMPEVTK